MLRDLPWDHVHGRVSVSCEILGNRRITLNKLRFSTFKIPAPCVSSPHQILSRDGRNKNVNLSLQLLSPNRLLSIDFCIGKVIVPFFCIHGPYTRYISPNGRRPHRTRHKIVNKLTFFVLHLPLCFHCYAVSLN